MDPPKNSATETPRVELEAAMNNELEKNMEPFVEDEEPPFSVFTKTEKWTIVGITSLAGLFSPLTANIYLPAIPAISSAFHKSTELVNLTVTVYLVFQAISPVFWGSVSDNYGRRLALIFCLLILSATCVGLALVPTSAFWSLLLLRCVQAFGSASTIAIGAGVIGDIALPEERGGFFGLFGLGPLTGPAVAPVVGGALEQRFGWRSIFWFLCIASGLCIILLILVFPETLRLIVANGSTLPPAKLRPVLAIIGPKCSKPDRFDISNNIAPRSFKNPLHLLSHINILILLASNGVSYAVFCSITATISTLFKRAYPDLSSLQIGLCFLASGCGMLLGSVVTGKLLNKDYIAAKKQQDKTQLREGKKDSVDGPDFPIERTRLRSVPIYIGIFTMTVMSYGWSIQRTVHLAVPLVLQFIVGYTTIAVLNTTQTLIVDLVPEQGSSITACNNLIRCLMGAALVAVIEPLTNALKPGWTYFMLGGISAMITLPSVYLLTKLGPTLRIKRHQAT